jgi:hypothetical protein
MGNITVSVEQYRMYTSGVMNMEATRQPPKKSIDAALLAGGTMLDSREIMGLMATWDTKTVVTRNTITLTKGP